MIYQRKDGVEIELTEEEISIIKRGTEARSKMVPRYGLFGGVGIIGNDMNDLLRDGYEMNKLIKELESREI